MYKIKYKYKWNKMYKIKKLNNNRIYIIKIIK